MNKVTDGVDIATIMQKQCDLADLLVNQQRQAGLPKKEIQIFSGDPLKYKSFMQSFKCNIEDKTNNNQDRLYFLDQFCNEIQFNMELLFQLRELVIKYLICSIKALLIFNLRFIL